MCEHCFNASDFQLPSGVSICTDCFHESYCRTCWQHTDVVGATSLYDDLMLCTTCVNNLPQRMPRVINDINTIIYNIIPVNAMDTDEHDGTFDPPLLDQYMIQDNYEEDEPWPIAPIEDEDSDEDALEDLFGPPAGFDMNMASLVEENPDYMDNLINAQIEFEGNWYFTLDGQIYSVPYEIYIDDDHVRRDIIDNWDGVQWRGSIFGNYIAWY